MNQSDLMPLPLDFWTDDLDESIEHYRRKGIEIFRTVSSGTEFGWGYQVRHGRDVITGVISQRGRQQLRAGQDQNCVLLHLSLDYEREYFVGNKTFISRPDTAVLVPPCHIYSSKKPSGRDLSLVIRHSTLSSLLNERWAGRSGHCTAKPVELRVIKRLESLLREQIRALENQSSPSQHWQNQKSLDTTEQDLLAIVADEIAAQHGLQPLSPRRKVRIEFLERWIDENLQADISVDMLSRACGVRPHTLTKTVLAARGMTPKEYLTSRRLTAANHLLMAESKSVSHAAHTCGFSHLGRFAAAYRHAFGETPSDTLSKRRLNKS